MGTGRPKNIQKFITNVYIYSHCSYPKPFVWWHSRYNFCRVLLWSSSLMLTYMLQLISISSSILVFLCFCTCSLHSNGNANELQHIHLETHTVIGVKFQIILNLLNPDLISQLNIHSRFKGSCILAVLSLATISECLYFFLIVVLRKGFYNEAVVLLNKAIKGEKNEKGLYINRGGT